MDVAALGGMIKAIQNASEIVMAENEDGYVYIAGQVASTIRADFGVTKYPIWCSKGLSIGKMLTLAGDPLNKSDTVCSGQIIARGRQTDIFLIKYSALTGEQQWLKRIGQDNTLEEAVGLAVDAISGQAFIAGSFSLDSQSQIAGYHDIFDLVSAGRPRSLGCPVNVLRTVDSEGKIQAMNPLIGTPNCSFTAHTSVPNLKAACVISISISNLDHGYSSKPWSQCRAKEDSGCNADGVQWAKSIGSGKMETRSTTAESISTGIIITRFHPCSENL